MSLVKRNLIAKETKSFLSHSHLQLLNLPGVLVQRITNTCCPLITVELINQFFFNKEGDLNVLFIYFFLCEK